MNSIFTIFCVLGLFCGFSVRADEIHQAQGVKQHSYRTACVGKWHLGWNWSDIQKPGVQPQTDAKKQNNVFAPDAFDWSKPISGGPLSHGFDSYFGDDVPNFPPYAWFENDRVITKPTEPLNITPQTKEGSWEARPGPMTPGWDFYAVVPRITDKAVEWIGKQRGQKAPCFLYAPFNSPHAPIVPTDAFTGKSQAGGFGDFMTQTDAEVGRDLRADLAQKQNLYAKEPARVKELNALLATIRAKGQVR